MASTTTPSATSPPTPTSEGPAPEAGAPLGQAPNEAPRAGEGQGPAPAGGAPEADLGAAAPYELRFRAGNDPLAARRVDAIGHTVAPLGIALAQGPAHGGADISPLLAAGVPIAELQQDATRYFDVHHTASDTLRAVDRDGLARMVAGVVSVAFGASEMNGDLGRVPEDQRGEH
jgi:hypothetical protein